VSVQRELVYPSAGPQGPVEWAWVKYLWQGAAIVAAEVKAEEEGGSKPKIEVATLWLSQMKDKQGRMADERAAGLVDYAAESWLRDRNRCFYCGRPGPEPHGLALVPPAPPPPAPEPEPGDFDFENVA
jgi:hypothetical protein